MKSRGPIVALLAVSLGLISCSESTFEPQVRQILQEDQAIAGRWTQEVFSPVAGKYGPGGLLYLRDDRGGIDRYSVDGDFVDSWNPGWIQERITGFGFGAGETIYLLQRYENRVQVRDADWGILREWDLPDGSRYDDIEVMDSGVFVLDNFMRSILVYSQAGALQARWSITVPSGTLWSVASGPSGELLVVSSSGVYRYRPDGEWLGTYQVPNPLDAFSPDDGTVHVGLVDGTVRTFFTDGSPSVTWGADADGIATMRRAASLTADPSGDIYVTDYLLRRVNRFSADRTFLGSWDGDPPADGKIGVIGPAVQGPEGDYYVMDHWFSRICRYDAAGNFVSAWGERGLGWGTWYDAADFTIAPTGQVFVLKPSTIQRFSGAGEFEVGWDTDAGLGIAADSRSNLYVTGFTRVHKYSPDGDLLAEFPGVGRPEGVAVDAEDRIYVVDRIGKDVHVFDPDGNVLEEWPLRDQGFRIDLDIAVDAAGQVYVCDSPGRKVEIYSRTGEFLAAWAGSEDAEGYTAVDFRPASINVDASDRIMIMDSGRDEVVFYRKIQGAGLD